MTDDANDPVALLEERQREELERAWRDVLSSPSGQRVVFWWLEQCSIYQDAFTGDNNATNYELGRQSAGRRAIAQMDAIDPRLYPKLLADMAELRVMDKAAAAQSEKEDDDEVA